MAAEQCSPAQHRETVAQETEKQTVCLTNTHFVLSRMAKPPYPIALSHSG
jgi:hypothetical protein